MSNATITVKMKSKTGKGVAAADKVWFNTGKGVNFADINVGDVVDLTYNGDNGVNFVSAYRRVTGEAVKVAVPPVPSLPKTTVTETKAPGGDLPIAKANKKEETTTMSKEEWRAKDRSIALLSIVGKVLGSPAYAQMTVGRREDESFEVGGRMVDFFVAKLDGLR